MQDKKVAIVQARMGSSRLPGKSLAYLGEHRLIDWVIKRLEGSRYIDAVVVAVPDTSMDDELVDRVHDVSEDFLVLRGDENDVMGRFVSASREEKADVVVRICADSPFTDVTEVDKAIALYLVYKEGIVFNHTPRSGLNIADGFGAEVFSANDLYASYKVAGSRPNVMEHVTTQFYQSLYGPVRSPIVPETLRRSDLRFDVDTAADLEYLNSLTNCGVNIGSTAPEIVRIADQVRYDR